METIECDIVILGSGIAGLTTAIHSSNESNRQLRISIVTKLHAMRSHSVAAEGGVSGVLYPEVSGDSIDLHAYDTVKGSDFLADQDAVEILAKNAPEEIRFLDHLGVAWSRDEKGRILQRPFGGMSQPRTAFAQDKTGFFIMRALYDEISSHKNVSIFHEHFAYSLIIERGRFSGLVCMDLASGESRFIKAKVCVIATGGASRVYGFTTTSHSTTGDGIALAYRAGIPLKDMEFVQFHPTALVPNGILITEAARGEGAYLLNSKGKRFMEDYAKSKMELAPRDIVSRAIITEIEQGRGFTHTESGLKYVHLDLRHLGKKIIDDHLPMIKEISIKSIAIDPVDEPLPVRPAAHFTMGGINTDIHGRAVADENGNVVKGVWAIGECGCVSVHGSNRLGSNSLSQCAVWGRLVGKQIAAYASSEGFNKGEAEKLAETERDRLEELASRESGEDPYKIKEEMQEAMDEYLYVYRNRVGMTRAKDKIEQLKERFSNVYVKDKSRSFNTNLRDVLEIGNLLDIAEAIAIGAMHRKETRGAHAVVEYPKRNDKDWLKHTLIFKNRGKIGLAYIPVKITKWKPVERVY